MEENKNMRLAVPPDVQPGMRIDVYLAKECPHYTRAFIQRCIKQNTILVNGAPCENADMVKPDSVISINVTPQAEAGISPEEIPLDILYEDEYLLVVNKSPGLVVHPANGHASGTLVNALLAYCDNDEFDEMIDDERRPGIVHRLDKDTSGALIIAKNIDVRNKLKEAFKGHEVSKIYLAIILGVMPELSGEINLAIGRHPYNRVKMAVVSECGKEAITEYRTLCVNRLCSLVKVRLHTGRTHQIRVHFSHFNHPVLGDSLYGGRPANTPMPVARQMLHAWKLSFKHPVTGNELKIFAPPPCDFMNALAGLGLSIPE